MVSRTSESKDNPPEVCKLYAAGKCRSGERCKLLHEPTTTQATNTRVNQRANDQEVKSVEDPVACTSIPSQAENVAPESGGPAIKVVRKVGETCRQWQKGRCRWGERCHFQHEVKTDQLKGSLHDAGNAQPPTINILPLASTSTPSPIRNKSKKKGKSKTPLSAANSPSSPNSHETALRRVREQAVAARLARIEQGETAQKGREELAACLTQERELGTARKRRSGEFHRPGETRENERTIERQRQEQEWVKESAVSIQQVILNCIVKFGSGLTISHVVCGFETSQILVKNLPMKTTKSEIVEFFTRSGYGIDEQNLAVLRTEATLGHQQAIVVVKTADLKTFLSNNIQSRGVGLEPLACAQSSEGRTMSLNSNFHLTISWRIPTLTIVARYPDSKAWNIRIMARKLNGQVLNGQQVQVEYEEQQLYRNFSPDPEYGHSPEPNPCPSIKISLIPARTTTAEIMTFVGTQDVEPHYTSLTSKEIFDALDARFCVLPNSMLTTFTFERPSDPDIASAKAVFSSWEGARLAHDNLNGDVVRPDFPPLEHSLSDQYSFILTLAENEYRAQWSQWVELTRGSSNGTTIQIEDVEYDYGRGVVVTLSGPDEKVVGAMKVRIENLISGQRLDPSYLHPEFKSPKGQKFLDSLYDSTSAYARFDREHNCITLSGDSEAIDAAKAHIQEEIERLWGEKWTIPLQRRALSFFRREGLEKMKALLGEESVTLDEKASKIVLHGTDLEEAKHHLKQLTNAFAESDADHSSATATVSNGALCPICGGAASQPIEIACQHVHCTSCLRSYILSTLGNQNFPLKCMGNNATCGMPLSLPLIQKLLPPQRFEQVMVAAFTTHLHKNPGTFRYCTTPDCSQLYRITPFQHVLQCPSCFSEICAACHAEGHAGVACTVKRTQQNAGTPIPRNAMTESSVTQPEGHVQITADRPTTVTRRMGSSITGSRAKPPPGTSSTMIPIAGSPNNAGAASARPTTQTAPQHQPLRVTHRNSQRREQGTEDMATRQGERREVEVRKARPAEGEAWRVASENKAIPRQAGGETCLCIVM